MPVISKFTEEDNQMLDSLGLPDTISNDTGLSAEHERIIVGFEDIQLFVTTHEREPLLGDGRDIFERIYATRLEAIRTQPSLIELLKNSDHQGLLSEGSVNAGENVDDLDDDELIAKLGLDQSDSAGLTDLRHIQPKKKLNPAEEIGVRTPCNDFHIFKPLFEKAQLELADGLRKTVPFTKKDSCIREGDMFILRGQTCFIADVGERFINADNHRDARLRVIFNNAVESNQLMRSFKKRLWEDPAGRRIAKPAIGPLFSGLEQKGDIVSGVIYVCRSLSNLPQIKNNKDNIHKIGVTGKDPTARIAQAKDDPTFLFAEAELVTSFKLVNIKPHKLETMLHQAFAPTKLDIEIPDRFNKMYRPQEWFLVPLPTIKDAVEKIKNGTIVDYHFNSSTGVFERN